MKGTDCENGMVMVKKKNIKMEVMTGKDRSMNFVGFTWRRKI